MIYYNSLRWSCYVGTTFFTLLGIVYPVTAMGSLLCIAGLLSYLLTDTYKIYAKILYETNNKDKAKIIALSNNAIDFILFFLSIFLAFYLGGK